jgi:drug/metabolite transporter (DMT)-like permease
VTNALKAHIAVLLTNLFFAVNYSFIKLISPALIKPFGLNVYRVGISLILFWMVWMFGKTAPGIKRKDIGRFILCGLTGIAINQMLFIKGLTMTSTVHASLLMLTTPLLITVFAFVILKEAVTLLKIAGLIMGVSGAALLIMAKESEVHASNYLFGDLLIFLNAISYSIYFILVKPLMQTYSPLHVVRWVFTLGFFMILLFGWFEADSVAFEQFKPNHFIYLAFIVLTGTFLAYYFTAYGLQHLGAGKTGAYIYTQPVFAFLFAAILLSETLSIQKIIAACLIFTGVYLVTLAKQKKILVE